MVTDNNMQDVGFAHRAINPIEVLNSLNERLISLLLRKLKDSNSIDSEEIEMMQFQINHLKQQIEKSKSASQTKVAEFVDGDRVLIPVSAIEFNVGGNTIWVQSIQGSTIMRLKTDGRINVDRCESSPTSHTDIMIKNDINFCLSGDAEK